MILFVSKAHCSLCFIFAGVRGFFINRLLQLLHIQSQPRLCNCVLPQSGQGGLPSIGLRSRFCLTRYFPQLLHRQLTPCDPIVPPHSQTGWTGLKSSLKAITNPAIYSPDLLEGLFLVSRYIRRLQHRNTQSPVIPYRCTSVIRTLTPSLEDRATSSSQKIRSHNEHGNAHDSAK